MVQYVHDAVTGAVIPDVDGKTEGGVEYQVKPLMPTGAGWSIMPNTQTPVAELTLAREAEWSCRQYH